MHNVNTSWMWTLELLYVLVTFNTNYLTRWLVKDLMWLDHQPFSLFFARVVGGKKFGQYIHTRWKLKCDAKKILVTTIVLKMPLGNLINKYIAHFGTYSLCSIYVVWLTNFQLCYFLAMVTKLHVESYQVWHINN